MHFITEKALFMPTNLHALIRYRTLDACFRDRRRNKNWEQLAAACGDTLRDYGHGDLRNPARRTIMGDIENMKSGKLGYEAPIHHTRELGYHYTIPDFSIDKQALSSEYRDYMRDALFTLKQFTWCTQLRGLDDIIARLEHGVLGEAHPQSRVIFMDIPSRFTGATWLDLLLKAIQMKKRVRIVYQPFTFPEPYSTEVSPYILKEYNGRWFLGGFDHPNDRHQNFGLDRIKQIHVLDTDIRPCAENLREHYSKVVGVTVHPEQPMERVVFRAIPEQAFYIHNKPVHLSQRILRTTEEGTVFAIDVIPNYELESLLLSFGERIEVLEPQSLRTRLLDRFREATRHYDKNDPGQPQ
jgi:predicted DNA-binding transcriptional regulator YafY